MKTVLYITALCLLSACGVETATTAVAVTKMEAEQTKQAKEQLDQTKDQLEAAMQAAQAQQQKALDATEK